MQKARRKPAASPDAENRRSPCPVACSLDTWGDRWTLLVIRDLFLGRNRFRDFASAPEGIPTNILSDRLEKLCRFGIIKPIPAPDGTKWKAYALTAKGRALGPILAAVRDWGLRWEKNTRVMEPRDLPKQPSPDRARVSKRPPAASENDRASTLAPPPPVDVLFD